MPLSYEIFNTKWHVITCLTESIHLDCVLKSKGKIITIESRSLTANAKINHSVWKNGTFFVHKTHFPYNFFTYCKTDPIKEGSFSAHPMTEAG